MNERTIRSVLSASRADRIRACPGSARASWGLPSQSSPAAERGTRIHAEVARRFDQNQPKVDISPEEAEVAADLADFTADILRAENLPMIWVERPMQHGDWTGRADLVALNVEEKSAHIVDWKTGYAQEQTSDIAQGHLLTYLLKANVEITSVEFSLVYPFGALPPVEFDAEWVETIDQEVAAITQAATDSDAPRIPGEHCKFCPAMAGTTCPETCLALQSPPKELSAPGITSRSADEIAHAGRMWKQVKRFGGRLEGEIRSRLEAGAVVPGCSLTSGGVTKSIPDLSAAWRYLPDSIPAEVFLSACHGSLSGLSKAVWKYRKEQGEKVTQKDVAAHLEAILRDMIEEKPRSGSLKIQEELVDGKAIGD